MDGISLPMPGPDMDTPLCDMDVVHYLERALHLAKIGHIRACAVVAVCADGGYVSTCISKRGNNKDLLLLLGEADCLKGRIRDRIRFLNDGEI